MRKTIISMGAALVLMLSVGVTASAGHHAPCAGQVIQGSGLCRPGITHCYGSGQGCAFWGIDINGICDYWENCHGGAAYREQGADEAAQPAPNAAPQNQSGAGAVAESQPGAEQAAGYQAEAQTGYGTNAAGAGAYGAYNGYSYGCGAEYGNGGHCATGGYTTGCHGSGHHGHGHH